MRFRSTKSNESNSKYSFKVAVTGSATHAAAAGTDEIMLPVELICVGLYSGAGATRVP